jgi:DNA repair protein RadC
MASSVFLFCRLTQNLCTNFPESTIDARKIIITFEVRRNMNLPQADYILRASGLHNREVEVFSVILLDEHLQLVRVVELARGYWDHVLVDPKKILERAKYWETPNVILAHHHPGETAPVPSQDDLILTRDFQRFLRKHKIRLLDHVVLGTHESVSIKENHPGFLRRVLRAIFG